YNGSLALTLRSAAPDAIYYTRDYLTLSAARYYKPSRSIFWEVHSLASTPRKRQMQAATARQLGGVITITQHMADALIELGVDADRVMVAPDGIRAERFSHMPARSEARAALGLPEDAFMVGYMGRLHTLNMGKGVDTIVQAIAARPEKPLHLLLVGGPDDMIEEYCALWRSLGLPEERFHGFGAVPSAEVPGALAAFDVAVMPFPWTEHFAYYASPLKLFEYMASERPIVATALPSTQEIVTDGENALLVPPSDVNGLADALVRLYDDPALGQRLAAAARQEVFARYTWAARAADIMAFIARHA
ncbi:MAG: glycosyltransferase family 4 protein, partial [Firmicutes bacterium]|nr:glycosyltransferase family 4 protein [Bacillota bacterium]